MRHIPILRHGQPYTSVETTQLVHHATGQPVARVSLANSGMVGRDIHRMATCVLDDIPVADLIRMTREAGEHFMSADLPIGDLQQSLDDYIRDLSATTGMPVSYCRTNARKIHRIFNEIDRVIAGLTRGFPLEILDRGHGEHEGRMLSFYREANVLGAVLPSNSPGVHSLWMPAIALKCPLVLKPGREEPWSPFRIIQAFIAAGIPREAFGFYPTDHAGAGELLRNANRSMLFGGEATTRPYAGDPRVELHGPGYSKIVLGEDCADRWEDYLDLMVGSIAANGGRSCINCSGIWTPRNGRAIAEALAERLARVQALPADDPNAEIAAFANPQMAELMSQSIDDQMRDGAIDLTAERRGTPRLVKRSAVKTPPRENAEPPPRNDAKTPPRNDAESPPLGKGGQGGVAHPTEIAYLLPTIVWIEPQPVPQSGDAARRARLGDFRPHWEHPLANKEYLFPYAAVIECPVAELPKAIGPSLVVSAITGDPALIASLMGSPNVDRLNIGPIPTYQLSWDQPHEGNLFEHLYRQRAFQLASV